MVKASKMKNMIPIEFILFNGMNKRERMQNTSVPIKVMVTVAEMKFDSTSPLLTKITPKPIKKAPERASSSDSTTVHH